VEAATFIAAALAHSGVLVEGYEHREARIAESVIALVLLMGLVLSWVRPAWTRKAGIASQVFALVGTLVGLFTIVVGVGPQTTPDIAYHIGIVVVLVWGLVVAVRAAASDTG
jgi:FtsH-binding integral membrane protein